MAAAAERRSGSALPALIAAVAVVAVVAALAAAGCGGASAATSTGDSSAASRPSAAVTPTVAAQTAASPTRPPYAVGERVITFVDRSRTVRFPGQPPAPRTLLTVIRYPAQGPSSHTDVLDAPALRGAGPYPLVIFGHGFAVTPASYASLLQAWARAGYVVAAPIFPLENANAPGGPNESDIVHQPRDMRFVITRMLAASADPRSPLTGLIASQQVAVTGQSDGGETALVVAYDPFYVDRRVRAAVILSGAVNPGIGRSDFPSPSPPLLATQGTADTINKPRLTNAFFSIAPRPKYLLKLLGAPHLPPYTYEQPQLTIVERVTIAFLDSYLKAAPRGLHRMLAAGRVPRLAALIVRR